jgi:threonylcarbamoyladenosine tRNA methylthiotransferase MtaB
VSSPDVISLGCRLNTYESEVIRSAAQSSGLENTVIFNTCAVTAEAVRQARQLIRRTKASHPGSRLIVTGCAAQIDPQMFAAMPEVDMVLGNAEKLSCEAYRDFGLARHERVRVNSLAQLRKIAPHMVDGFRGHSRAFVQIQNGCDHRCTFCIIPHARGPSRSIAMGAVVEELRRLIDRGYSEVVLTGVDITSYGADLPGKPTLGRLVLKILTALPHLARLRLSSIDSIEADEHLFHAFADEPRLMPHIHLSLQSGDDLILKRMRRRHRASDSVAFCRKLRRLRPEIVFGADLIAGFPTETDAMFENTLRHIDDCGLTYLHVFPFSARPGTPAARMPQLNGGIIAMRAASLRRKADRLLGKFFEGELGKKRRVLTERGNRGRTEHYAPVGFSTPVEPGNLVTAAITAIDSNRLIAKVST